MTGDADVTLADRVAAAAERTVAAETARLFSASCRGSPVPQPGDQRYEGVADFGQRRAAVSGTAAPQRLMPEGAADKLSGLADTNPDLYAMMRMATAGHQAIYDGARELFGTDDRWFGTLGDTDGPRGHQDPVWPLDALFGANADAVEVAREPVRGTDAVHCRLTVDLLRADELLASGVNVPEGPLRRLRQIPAEVWLDAAGLARRIAVGPHASNASAPRDSWHWWVIEFWDFGVAVTITPPRPDEVAALDKMDLEVPRVPENEDDQELRSSRTRSRP